MIFSTALYALAPIVAFAFVWVVWRPAWMGFEGKAFWDWIALLAVPLVVGFATFLISANQVRIEQDRASELAMQNYFNRIGALVLDDRLHTRPQMRNALGRAETMAILRLVKGERAGRAFAFLSEMDLLHDFAVEFESLDLRGAELKGIGLDGLDFEGSDLTGADLEAASLVRADFEDALLRGVDFKSADLRGAEFDGADLSGAELDGADLRGTDLSAALGLTERQIRPACRDAGTKLPAGLARALPAQESCAAAGDGDDGDDGDDDDDEEEDDT